jgi:UDP-glucose 4-epimerase
MKIMVIGGAGYIGSHVVRALLDRGHAVAVYDNLSSGRTENLFDEAEWIEADILDYQSLCGRLREGFDGIVHLAAFKAAGESMEHPEKYSINNITGTINVLNACSSANVKKIVFSSSAAIYGEPRYLPVDEQHPANPENYYGFTKLEIERFLEWYDRIRGMRYAALRYFNAAGYDPAGRIRGLERNPANLLPVVMEVAAGLRDKLLIFGDDYDTRDGSCIRDYVHVSDLARAHVDAMEYLEREDASLTVNLGSESGVSVFEMVEAARRITGAPIPADIVDRRPGDAAKLVASSQRARSLLHWQPAHSDVDTLMSSTWNVYRGR